MSYYSYILKSEQTGKYYYGSTCNIEQRLAAHNKGKVRSTKGGRPWRLHYKEEFETRSAAYSREQFYKTIEGYRYLKDQKIT